MADVLQEIGLWVVCGLIGVPCLLAATAFFCWLRDPESFGK